MPERPNHLTETVSDWFEVREMRPDLWMICEPGHVASWLVVGSEQACLVDTGMGVVPIRPVVRAITPLPVVVVNTHYHFDHVGGNAEFEEVLAHPGADARSRATPEFVAGRYQKFASAREAVADQYREMDSEYFGLLSPETDPKPLMADFRTRMEEAVRRPALIRDLADGQTIKLGGRTLTVLHTPGHSPDSVCLLDDRDGVLLTGDTFNVGLVYCHFADSRVDRLRESAGRLWAIANDVSYVVAHHHPRLIGETELLRVYRDAVTRLDRRSAVAELSVDVLGQRCLYVADGPFTFTLPVAGSTAVV